jgi:hypothetical protein
VAVSGAAFVADRAALNSKGCAKNDWKLVLVGYPSAKMLDVASLTFAPQVEG